MLCCVMLLCYVTYVVLYYGCRSVMLCSFELCFVLLLAELCTVLCYVGLCITACVGLRCIVFVVSFAAT